MSNSLDIKWPMSLGAPAGSLEAKLPRPEDIGTDIPDPQRYFCKDFMQKEWELLWPKVWLLAGVTPDLKEPGDFITHRHGHEEFLIVRHEDNKIRAFYNVCPHRGKRVCQIEQGNVPKFSCPFHGWQFLTDGSLASITDEETYDADLIAHRPGLTEIRCETIGGSSSGSTPGYEYGDSKQANLQAYLQNEIGDRVYFETDKHNITSASAFVLESQANWLKSTPGFQLIVEGHCDERGTREYNLALGERRGNSVKDFLVSLGVDPGRITVISYGKERPAAEGSTSEAWSENRRAVTVVGSN